jgi:transposase
MFLKTTTSKGIKYLQIIQSYKKDGISRHRVIANLGRADVLVKNGLENIIASLGKLIANSNNNSNNSMPERDTNNQSLLTDNRKDISTIKENSRVNYGYIVYKKLWDKFSISELLDNITKNRKIKYKLSKVVFPLVINRLLSPSSKYYYYCHREQYYQYDEELELQQIYKALDILSENKEKIEEDIFNKNRTLFNMQIDIVFYDVTTYHFESQREDELRDFGFSKANKINEVQVVMGLLIDNEGRPIGYELFPGNTFDGKTILKVLGKLKKLFKLNQVIIVADKGINSKINLKEIKEHGFDYIVSARIRNMSKEVQEKILSLEGYAVMENQSEGEIYKYKVIDYENKIIVPIENTKQKQIITLKEKMVCTYSSRRAAKDQKDRQRAIEKAEKIINRQDTAQLKTKKGYKRYIAEEGKKESITKVYLDTERIEKEAKFDGYSAIEYSRENLSALEVLEQYHNLYRIEESFRIIKSTMQTRPIYLRLKEHIEGHFLICFLAFVLERELEFRLRKKAIAYSSEKIKESLNSVEFSEIEIENEKYYLKGKHNQLASEIFSMFRIQQPGNLLTAKQATEYMNP